MAIPVLNIPKPPIPLPHVRWRSSLYSRIIVLCVILVASLLASVCMISYFFFMQAAQEMEIQASQIADSVIFQFDEHPNMEYSEATNRVKDMHKGVEIQIEPEPHEFGAPIYSMEHHEAGRVMRVVRKLVPIGNRKVLLTTAVQIVPQVEIMRAFKNRYLEVTMAVFLISLALMVYFVSKALRPLKNLTESCVAISSGDLSFVNTRGATGEVRALEETFNSMVESLREKEAVEAKLRKAQRLSALGNLSAGVAHDVRNPLNAIKLLSSHTLDMVGDAPAAKSLRTIRREVERLENIVSNFLSLAKETELHPEPHPIDPLVDDCLQLFRPDAEARRIVLISDLRAGQAESMIDLPHITRAVQNILLNALEACPPEGRIRVATGIVDGCCEILVENDGAGLSKDMVDHAFEPYYTTKPNGTGLGLAITRGIVEEHGGTIELSSPEGLGCRVRILLPGKNNPT